MGKRYVGDKLSLTVMGQTQLEIREKVEKILLGFFGGSELGDRFDITYDITDHTTIGTPSNPTSEVVMFSASVEVQEWIDG